MKFATVTHFYHLLKPFLCAEVPETSFFTTQIEGAIFQGRARRIATNRAESRRIVGVGPLKTTNTLQTGKEHSNTPQRAEGTVVDIHTCVYVYMYVCMYVRVHICTYVHVQLHVHVYVYPPPCLRHAEAC